MLVNNRLAFIDASSTPTKYFDAQKLTFAMETTGEVTNTPVPPTKTQMFEATPSSTPTIHQTWTLQPTMTSTSPPTPGPGLGTPFGGENIYVVYRVQEGQSLVQIATLYNTSPEVIEASNELQEGRTVWPGDIIIIPVGLDDLNSVVRFTYRFVEKKTWC